MSFITSYDTWLYALAIGGVVYAALNFSLGLLSKEAKEELTLFLWGEYQHSWAELFNDLFDKFYGPKHLSLKCFIRSSMVSLIAVLILFLVYFSDSDFDLLMLLMPVLAGMLFNVIPDYVSLIETRWLLKKFKSTDRKLSILLFLILDLIFSSTIIILSIYGWHYSVTNDDISIVEIIFFYSFYAIFFYSTFASSIWIWAFCLSSGIVRLFNKIKLNRILDTEKRPEKQIAIVVSIIVFVLSLMASPLLKNDPETGVSRLDDYLCETFPGLVCDEVAERANDSQKALKYHIEACLNHAGNWNTCGLVVFKFGESLSFEQKVSLLNAGCRLGDGEACLELAREYEDMGDTLAALQTYESACDKVRSAIAMYNGCGFLGEYYLKAKDFKKSGYYLKLSCENLKPRYCIQLGRLYRNQLKNEEHSVTLATKYLNDGVAKLQRSCTRGRASDCSYLLRISASLPETIPKQLIYEAIINGLAQGCSKEYYFACEQLGDIYREGKISPSDREASDNWYLKSHQILYKKCFSRQDDLIGQYCSKLARHYELGLGRSKNLSKAKTFYQRACENDHADSCFAARQSD